jgi:hypothetical protein
MAEFLSAAWVSALDTAAREAHELRTESPFVVETVVRGPDGDAGYQVRFGPDGGSVASAGAAVPDVVLVTDRETAWALHQGTVRAQDAFARGALKVRGRPELLSARAELLVALARALAPVRAATTSADDR